MIMSDFSTALALLFEELYKESCQWAEQSYQALTILLKKLKMQFSQR